VTYSDTQMIQTRYQQSFTISQAGNVFIVLEPCLSVITDMGRRAECGHTTTSPGLQPSLCTQLAVTISSRSSNTHTPSRAL